MIEDQKWLILLRQQITKIEVPTPNSNFSSSSTLTIFNMKLYALTFTQLINILNTLLDIESIIIDSYYFYMQINEDLLDLSSLVRFENIVLVKYPLSSYR